MIKSIHICSQEGLDPRFNMAAKEAVEELLNYFGQYKDDYPVKNIGNWKSNNYNETTNRYIEIGRQHGRSGINRDGSRWSQLNASVILDAVDGDPTMEKYPQYQILLTKDDLWSGKTQGFGSEFITGVARPTKGMIVFSPARLIGDGIPYLSSIHLERFKSAMMHEFGHQINLTYEGRPNTDEHGGTHCKNNRCIMHQDDSGTFADVTYAILEDAKKDAEGRRAVICGDCLNAGMTFLGHQHQKALAHRQRRDNDYTR